MATAPDPAYESQRRAVAINDLLEQIGVSKGQESEWWNHRTYAELGNMTPTQAWLSGNQEGVRRLVDQWYRDTERALAERRRDPDFVAMLRRKIDALKTGLSHSS